MKKLLLLLIPIFLFSCSKQDAQPEEETPVQQEETVQAVAPQENEATEYAEPEEIIPPDILLTEAEESARIDTVLNRFLELVHSDDLDALKELFIPEQAEQYKSDKDYTFRDMFSNRQAYYGSVLSIMETGRVIDREYETADRRGTYAEVDFRIENEKAVSLEKIKLYRPVTEEGFFVLGYHYREE